MRQTITTSILRLGPVAATVVAAPTAPYRLLAVKPVAARFALFCTVKSAGDGPDANPGDDVCVTSGGARTLRGVAGEANGTTAVGVPVHDACGQSEGGERDEILTGRSSIDRYRARDERKERPT